MISVQKITVHILMINRAQKKRMIYFKPQFDVIVCSEPEMYVHLAWQIVSCGSSGFGSETYT